MPPLKPIKRRDLIYYLKQQMPPSLRALFF